METSIVWSEPCRQQRARFPNRRCRDYPYSSRICDLILRGFQRKRLASLRLQLDRARLVPSHLHLERMRASDSRMASQAACLRRALRCPVALDMSSRFLIVE
eukprot:scaffold145645_cov32-Tisochrysis_lutea.AAC.1